MLADARSLIQGKFVASLSVRVDQLKKIPMQTMTATLILNLRVSTATLLI
jgi:hypothetical protein